MLQPIILYFVFHSKKDYYSHFQLEKGFRIFWLTASTRNKVEIWIKELCEDAVDFTPFIYFFIDVSCKEPNRLWPDPKLTVVKSLVVKFFQL